MDPVKKSEIVKKAAEDLGMDIKIVEAVYDEYWASVRKKLTKIDEISSIDDLRVNIPKLGIFVVKERCLNRRIEELEGISKYSDKPIVRKKSLTTIDYLHKIREITYQFYGLRKAKQDQRKIYEEAKPNKSMEEQGSNP